MPYLGVSFAGDLEERFLPSRGTLDAELLSHRLCLDPPAGKGSHEGGLVTLDTDADGGSPKRK